MSRSDYTVRAKVWIYPGLGGWHFVTLPKEISAEIKARFAGIRRGWGSLPVAARIGQTSWNTSIFPDKKSGTYLLPVKADVRKSEKIAADKRVTVRFQVST